MVSSTFPDESSSTMRTSSHKSERKHHKKDKSERKRSREGDDGDAPRRHKKHRKHDDDEANDENRDASPSAQLAMEIEDSQRKEKRKKSKKSRKDGAFPIVEDQASVDTAPGMTEDSTALRTAGDTSVVEGEEAVDLSEHSRKKKRSKKHRHAQDDEPAPVDDAEQDGNEQEGHKKKRKRKHEKRHRDVAEDTETVGGTEWGPEDLEMQDVATAEKPEKRKEKKSKRREKHSTSEVADADAMDIVTSARAHLRPVNAPADPQFPFFTQKVYLYLPLYPAGFATPISSVAKQHLEPLVNHYSPMLRGVVLGYSNVSLADRPIARKTPQTDDTPAILESIDEYAVGFGWLTVDVSLFVPTRGAWMEGRVNLQNEGHIGVLCWEKFSASIDARRLPPGWKWIDFLGDEAEESHAYSNNVGGEAGDDPFADATQSIHQMHTTGYWVDATGKPVRDTMLFRIRDFEIGRVGDHGYLSIVGTMLTEEEEKALETEEREEQRKRRRRLNPAGLLRPETRRVPEFSITTFGKEDQEETAEQRLVFSKSRLNTPDD